jgi:hypothetical protein
MNVIRLFDLHQPKLTPARKLNLLGLMTWKSDARQNKWVRVLVVLSVCMCLSGVVRADVLFSTTISEGFTGQLPSNITFRIAYFTSTGGLPSGPELAPLFEDTLWDTSDVGTLRTATSTTDSNFDAFAALMTDGSNEWIRFGSAGGEGGLIFQEPALFFGNSQDSRVDLHGNRIDSISIELTSLSFNSTPISSYSYSYVFTVNGVAIPEPSSLALAFYGGVGLIVTYLVTGKSIPPRPRSARFAGTCRTE